MFIMKNGIIFNLQMIYSVYFLFNLNVKPKFIPMVDIDFEII